MSTEKNISQKKYSSRGVLDERAKSLPPTQKKPPMPNVKPPKDSSKKG